MKDYLKNIPKDWWKPDYNFFGEHYMEGDDSQEGYLELDQNLEERTSVEVAGLENLLKLVKEDRIIDLPCGYGRHSLKLLEKGYDVLGVDINEVHLSKAINASSEAGLSDRFKVGSMLDYQPEDDSEKFTKAINMFYSFGFFESDEDNFKSLKNFYDLLEKGGEFLMHTDVNIPRVIEGKYKFDEERNTTRGNILRVIDRYDPEKKRIDGAWIINNVVKKYSVRVFSQKEWSDWCLKAGFGSVDFYGDWDGASYSEDSEDMIAIAKK